MAIVLTATSLSAGTVASIYAPSETSTVKGDLANHSLDNALTFYTNFTDQEPVTLDEAEPLPFSLSDAPLFVNASFNRHSSMLSLASGSQCANSRRQPYHKFHLKNIVFPFHSFW